MQIILDTNALVYAAKNKLDLVQTLKEKFGLLAIYIPNLVIEELKILVNTADKASDREAASLALKIIQQKKIKEIQLSGETDKAIAEYAIKHQSGVLTNDLKLKYLLRSGHVKVYVMRQGNHIEEWN
ncbi:MAG: PIN domain-containing protein [DPANN group archaeon]|nr:PIN domain-containing protein [DPANN group archaeon]